MEFILGAPLAMLAFLVAPVFAMRFRHLWIVAGVGAMIPALMVLESRWRGSLEREFDPEARDALLVSYAEFFLLFLVFAVLARILGLALQARGWPRWRTLLIDLGALSPAIGFYGVLIASALRAAG